MIERRLMVPTIFSPSETYHGKGSSMVLKYIQANEFLILVSKTVKDTEHYGKISGYLDEKVFHEEIIEKASEEIAVEIGGKYADSLVEVIVGIGGGKVMDTAKVVRFLMDNPDKSVGDLAEIFSFEKLKRKLVLVPTTPGTGSEASTSAVIHLRGLKTPFTNKHFLPDIAILDSAFLSSLSFESIIPFGGDIFAHDFEAYFSKLSNPIVRAYTDGSLSLLMEAMNSLKDNLGDFKALDKLLLSGHLGGLAQGNAYVGACHALAHGAENLIKIPHSKAVLSLSKPCMKWLMEKTENKEYERFLASYDKLGFEGHIEKSIFESVNDEEWAEMALKDPSVKTSPVRMDKSLMLDLISFVKKERS